MKSNETFSSWPVSALVAGVKIGIDRLAFEQARRKRDAADRSPSAVFLPAHFQRDSHEPRTRKERPGPSSRPSSGPRVRRARRRADRVEPACDIGRDQVIGNLDDIEPVERKAGQDPALVGDAVGQHPVKRADAIGRDQEEAVAQVIDVANLAAAAWGFAAAEIGLEQNHGVRADHFLSTISRKVSPRKIQLDGAAEIGPLMPKTAIW